jgi:hypothetical protein
VASPRSGNRDELIASLAQVDYGNGTRLYDALGASLEELVGVEGRKVVLVFTDGDDTASRMRFGTVLDRAQVDEVMVYAIGLAGETFAYGRPTRTRTDSSLKKLAAETGGGYFELSRADQLTSTFTRVALELHSQCAIHAAVARWKTLLSAEKKPGMTAGRGRVTWLLRHDGSCGGQWSVESARDRLTTGAGN